MFKEYVMNDVYGDNTLNFFVYARKTRNGFCHEARMAGFPRTRDDVHDFFDVPMDMMYVKVPYFNRTWESWEGQTALSKLWSNLSKFKDRFAFFDKENPFAGYEPEHKNLYEPDWLFGPFRKGGR